MNKVMPVVGMRVTSDSQGSGTVSSVDGDGGYCVDYDNGVKGGLYHVDLAWKRGAIRPLDTPAPAEAAKPAGFTPQPWDTVVVFATVAEVNHNDHTVFVNFPEYQGKRDGTRLYFADIRRPEAAPPAAASERVEDYQRANAALERGLAYAQAELEKLRAINNIVPGQDSRGLASQLADASSKRDEWQALAVKRELELGDMQRRCDRLALALKAARAVISRRGPL